MAMQTATPSTATAMTVTIPVEATLTALERYLAGCARLDKALKACCPRCGAGWERADDLGSIFMECSSCLNTVKVSR